MTSYFSVRSWTLPWYDVYLVLVAVCVVQSPVSHRKLVWSGVPIEVLTANTSSYADPVPQFSLAFPSSLSSSRVRWTMIDVPVVLLIWQIAVSIFKLGNLSSEPLDLNTEIIIVRRVFDVLRSGHRECLADWL